MELRSLTEGLFAEGTLVILGTSSSCPCFSIPVGGDAGLAEAVATWCWDGVVEHLQTDWAAELVFRQEGRSQSHGHAALHCSKVLPLDRNMSFRIQKKRMTSNNFHELLVFYNFHKLSWILLESSSKVSFCSLCQKPFKQLMWYNVGPEFACTWTPFKIIQLNIKTGQTAM